MPLCELEAKAIKACFVELVENLDMKDILDFLYQEGEIDDNTAKQIQESKFRVDTTRLFFFYKVEQCSFKTLLKSLQGHAEFLANKLLQSLKEIVKQRMEHIAPSEALVHAVHSPYCFIVNKAYQKIYKSYYDGELKTFLKEVSKVEYQWYHRETLSKEVIMMLSDLHFKLVLLQSRHFAFKGNFKVENEMFCKLEEVLPYTSNVHLFKMTMIRWKAIVLSMKNSMTEAENMALDAISISTSLPNCDEAVRTFVTGCTIELSKNELLMTEKEKRYLVAKLDDARHMIQSLHNKSSEEVLETKRCIFAIAGLVLLNISKEGKELENSNPTREEINQAKKNFTELEKPYLWTGLSQRWKTVVFLGKAKISLSENKPLLAKQFTNYAKFCAEKVPYLSFLQESVYKFEEKNRNCMN